MKCEIVKKNLSAYLDGELDQKEMKQIFDHLENCEECQQELELLEELNGSITDYYQQFSDSLQLDNLYSDVLKTIEAEKEEKKEELVLSKDLFNDIKESIISKFFSGFFRFSPAIISAAVMMFIVFGVSKNIVKTDISPKKESVTVDSLEYSRFNAMIYKTKEQNKTVIWLFKQESDDDFDDPI